MRIITDSSCDLPSELIEKFNVLVVPLRIEIDGIDYVDGVNLSHEEFFEKMSTSASLPKTSQPSPQSFIDRFTEGLKESEDLLSIHLSSCLSGTYEGARQAKEGIKGNIEVFDTLSGSLGVGLQVLKACQLAKEGLEKSEVLEKIKEYREQLRVVVYLETLENAVKGGRVSRPKEFISNLLNLKPVVHVEDGYVRVLKTLRGKKKAIRVLLEEMEKKKADYSDQIVGITHCDCLEEAQKLKDEIIERFNPSEVILTTMGPVIGTHAGIGGLLVCF
ncbi:DegV family protein [Tindallia californiensis]|uniref:EDD domain protein, DegV family n=1 Tax=Tindallia californiensis TaxID=159292 RepID=A0A1H3KAV3_9FIRM|nr:DegV family protein [Tindallia californiensis]SDY48895.1 EDD domain protein, DegV family [Tindallia californiensis]